MALAGDAAVIIWNDVVDAAQSDFLAWHNREHLPERVGIPGFQRGRRGRALSGGPEYITLYEADDLTVLKAGRYIERLDSPTEWTRRILPQFRNTSRSVCRTGISLGRGMGGILASIRFGGSIPDGDVSDARARFRGAAVRCLAASPEIVGVHLLLRDDAASGLNIEESRLRTESVSLPGTIVLVEATSVAPIEAVAGVLVDFLAASVMPASDGIISVYQLEICMTRADRD